MKTRLVRYLKHVGFTMAFVLLILIPFGIYEGAQLTYGHNPSRLNFNGEGPYAFYENDSTVNVKYIQGNKDDGFYITAKKYAAADKIPASVFFPLDSSSFNFTIRPAMTSPKSIYKDDKKILAISDIESGFNAFRNFLIQNQVIDSNLKWIFGGNHLVLLGDFVDRGFSTTQVLWFIYKLEQDAEEHGGQVHFILGNHELKNMYGDHQASSLKYTFVASMIDKTQSQLYSRKSVLGNWLASKNTIESINGNIFVHGGLHPDLAELEMSIPEINQYLRSTYYKAPYPKVDKDEKELLISSKKGISWYRGYFKEDLSQKEIERPLEKFNAKAVIVGHTPQFKVKKFYEGKVFAIDVKHAKDYHKNWPDYDSEGLMILGNNYYRVKESGEQIAL
ncbi:metallophosphoesterase [Zunongwangia sp. HGR-M22]|uniref:metallophosphoesterase n=1 Tax=Zunongwangia sp. HGR-M22 TaxID=3015168 RepID=UPI0022DDE51C|nr:metallophosphoesterase [Zunongwangia sp. HGR-M22]WBL24467.1 metallophosphoesterase [Zunongwangia sp. HGR-M22]